MVLTHLLSILVPVLFIIAHFSSSFVDADFVQDLLRKHNEFRAIHDASQLTLDAQLTAKAQSIAQNAAKKGRFSKTQPGINTYMACATYLRGLSGVEVTEAWYNGVCDDGFTFEKPKSDKASAFTQLVWKDTRSIGVGVSNATKKDDKGNTCKFVVVEYRPPGNVEEKPNGIQTFIDNIGKGRFDPKYCDNLRNKKRSTKEDRRRRRSIFYRFPVRFYIDPLTGQTKGVSPVNNVQRQLQQQQQPYTPSLERNIITRDVSSKIPSSGRYSNFYSPPEISNPSTRTFLQNSPSAGSYRSFNRNHVSVDALVVHNILRRIHKSPEMVLDEGMTIEAEAVANGNAMSGTLEHTKMLFDQGENLAFRCVENGEVAKIGDSITDWYQEVCKGNGNNGYDFSKTSAEKSFLHFTQVVWAKSTRLGCGSAVSRNMDLTCYYFCCRYKEQGNTNGEFHENVHKGSFGAAKVCPNIKKIINQKSRAVPYRTEAHMPAHSSSLQPVQSPISGHLSVSTHSPESRLGYSPMTVSGYHSPMQNLSPELGQVAVVSNHLLPGTITSTNYPHSPIHAGSQFHEVPPACESSHENTAQQDEDERYFQDDSVRIMNRFRAIHDTAPLVVDCNLHEEAKVMANTLVSSGGSWQRVKEKLKNRKEGIYQVMCVPGGQVIAPPEGMSNWYREACTKTVDFNLETEDSLRRAPHFAQMLWNASKKVGVAYATKAKPKKNMLCTVVVAKFDPPGNNVGEYTKNIHRGKFDKSFCGSINSIAESVTQDGVEESSMVIKPSLETMQPLVTPTETAVNPEEETVHPVISPTETVRPGEETINPEKPLVTAIDPEEERIHPENPVEAIHPDEETTVHPGNTVTPEEQKVHPEKPAETIHPEEPKVTPIEPVHPEEQVTDEASNKLPTEPPFQETETPTERPPLILSTTRKPPAKTPKVVAVTEPPTEAPTVAPVTPRPTDQNESSAGFDEQALRAHNRFRKIHGVPPMSLDEEMTRDATFYAKRLAATGSLRHANNLKDGENLAMKCNSGESKYTGDKPVTAWYNEVCSPGYRFNPQQGFSLGTGHFTQLIWKQSLKLGVGVAKGRKRGMNCYFTVARYRSPGNTMSRFGENVPQGGFSNDKVCDNVDRIGVGDVPNNIVIPDGGGSTGIEPTAVVDNFGNEASDLSTPTPSTSTSDSSDPSDPTTSTADLGTNFEEQGLNAHNKFRKLHDAPPMTINSRMSLEASAYAQKIARRGRLQHASGGSADNPSNDGENLAYKCSSNMDTYKGQDPVIAWYAEVCDPGYTFNPPTGFTSGTGHFTQVVWRDSTELGIGKATSSKSGMDCVYTVARYRIPGNMNGQFESQVLKGQFSDYYCGKFNEILGSKRSPPSNSNTTTTTKAKTNITTTTNKTTNALVALLNNTTLPLTTNKTHTET